MNWMLMRRKLLVICRRRLNRIKRKLNSRVDPRAAATEKRKAINIGLADLHEMFSPRVCYILTVWAGKTNAHMAPVKWITEIRFCPHKIVMGLFAGGDAEKLIRKSKGFTVSQVSNKYARDYYKLIQLLPAKGTVRGISRFRAEDAFFIKGFKVNDLPWIECTLDRIIKVDNETSIVIGKVIHISKKQHANKEKLIHYKGERFINTKTISVKPWSKI